MLKKIQNKLNPMPVKPLEVGPPNKQKVGTPNKKKPFKGTPGVDVAHYEMEGDQQIDEVTPVIIPAYKAAKKIQKFTDKLQGIQKYSRGKR